MSLNRSNPPAWVLANPLLRQLYLWRLTRLTRHARPHWSQFGEDLGVRHLLGGLEDGFFVDVGCFHPMRYSNTWMLYRRGWRGVNIDLDEIKVAAFDLVRPEDVNLVAAVSAQEGEIEYFRQGPFSLNNTLDAEFARSTGGFTSSCVRARTLTALLDETRFAGRPIDFLSVDAEGHDDAVLAGLDFERYRPGLIAVETHEQFLADVTRTGTWERLTARGYDLAGWCGLSLLFAGPDLRERLGGGEAASQESSGIQAV